MKKISAEMLENASALEIGSQNTDAILINEQISDTAGESVESAENATPETLAAQTHVDSTKDIAVGEIDANTGSDIDNDNDFDENEDNENEDDEYLDDEYLLI